MSQQSLDDQGQDHAECEMETSCESRDISENIQVIYALGFSSTVHLPLNI